MHPGRARLIGRCCSNGISNDNRNRRCTRSRLARGSLEGISYAGFIGHAFLYLELFKYDFKRFYVTSQLQSRNIFQDIILKNDKKLNYVANLKIFLQYNISQYRCNWLLNQDVINWMLPVVICDIPIRFTNFTTVAKQLSLLNAAVV